jgi:pre-mRNA-splicing factor CDC5/CEF1
MQQTPTPLRDEFGLNRVEKGLAGLSKPKALKEEEEEDEDDDFWSVTSSRKEWKERKKQQKSFLQAQLSNLSNPKHRYQASTRHLEMEVEEDEERRQREQDNGTSFVEDAADRERREEEERREQERLLTLTRSSVFQRKGELPFVASSLSKWLPSLDTDSMLKKRRRREEDDDDSLLQASVVQGIIRSMCELEEEDAHQDMQSYEPSIELAYLQKARAMVNEEAKKEQEPTSFERFKQQWEEAHQQVQYNPSKRRYEVLESAEDKLRSLQWEFERTKEGVEREAKRARKLETKVAVLTKGYKDREGRTTANIQQLYQQLSDTSKQVKAFERLAGEEEVGIEIRSREASSALETLQNEERQLQHIYKSLHRQVGHLALQWQEHTQQNI